MPNLWYLGKPKEYRKCLTEAILKLVLFVNLQKRSLHFFNNYSINSFLIIYFGRRNNQNPVWQTPLQLEYKFEVFQKLIIRVGDDDDKGMDAIGQVVSTILDSLETLTIIFRKFLLRIWSLYAVGLSQLFLDGKLVYICAPLIPISSSEDKGRGSLIMTAEEVYQNVTQYKGFT